MFIWDITIILRTNFNCCIFLRSHDMHRVGFHPIDLDWSLLEFTTNDKTHGCKFEIPFPPNKTKLSNNELTYMMGI